ncbi:MAG TPA: hypothetical protein VIK27_07225, partial [Candidatus Aquilonibacter sp.]
MKRGRLLDDVTAQSLDVAWLREALAPVSPYGARRFASIEPFVPGEEARAQAQAECIVRVAGALDAQRLDAARDVARRVPDVS